MFHPFVAGYAVAPALFGVLISATYASAVAPYNVELSRLLPAYYLGFTVTAPEGTRFHRKSACYLLATLPMTLSLVNQYFTLLLGLYVAAYFGFTPAQLVSFRVVTTAVRLVAILLHYFTTCQTI